MATKNKPGSKAAGAASSGKKQSAKPSAENKMSMAAYRGDGSVMLTFDLPRKPDSSFRGFAIHCKPPTAEAFWLKNRLSFANRITKDTDPSQRQEWATPSNQAPFQKFRWIDFTSWGDPGVYTYSASAMYAKAGGLEEGEKASVTIELGPYKKGNLEVGFTRAFLSSQAYHDRFHNDPIRPKEKSIDYDTQPFQQRYEWLGFHARKLMFAYLNELKDLMARDNSVTVDLFAYDLDEPDLIRQLVQYGKKLRAFLDDAPLHKKPGALEIQVHQALLASAGADNVKQGHFHRFAHDKVIICRKNGVPISVLTGSANFSVRGLYVQANNVLVFRDPQVAQHYGEAFDEAFADMTGFSHSEIAEGWIELPPQTALPRLALAFSPHTTASVSLNRIAQAVHGASRSVLFAIMELGGSGPVLEQIKGLTNNRRDIFSYGVTQSKAGTTLYKPGSSDGVLTSFAYLNGKVPPPFNEEISGGAGQVIHDKFVVVDFGTDSCVVYTGSSNLAGGGEENNGDNLIEIKDPEIASIFAVQAIGLVDHFHFRANQRDATDAQPLVLRTDDWAAEYYQKGTLKYKERELFCP